MKKRILALAAMLAMAVGAQASSIVPAQPAAFDLVNLRMMVDTCAFIDSGVRVRLQQNNFIVATPLNRCLAPGAQKIVDIRLGVLPPGSYTVSIHENPSDFRPPYETLRFEVAERPEIAIFPPPVRPLTDYSGLWFNASESGWGLSIHQGPNDILFAILYVYNNQSVPEWYTIQGRWSGTTLWSGTVYRTTGPSFANPVFNPNAVLYAGYGTATIDFQVVPSRDGTARIDYTINGVSASKIIQRMAL